jgi:hypothetical protein
MVRASHKGAWPSHLQMATACYSSRARVCTALHVDEQICAVGLLEGDRHTQPGCGVRRWHAQMAVSTIGPPVRPAMRWIGVVSMASAGVILARMEVAGSDCAHCPTRNSPRIVIQPNFRLQYPGLCPNRNPHIPYPKW